MTNIPGEIRKTVSGGKPGFPIWCWERFIRAGQSGISTVIVSQTRLSVRYSERAPMRPAAATSNRGDS